MLILACTCPHRYPLKQVFREIYDARTRYTAKPEMQPLSPTDLSIGDLVLVECWLVRSRIDRSSHAWTAGWTTAFQLRSLSLLLSRNPSDSHVPSIDIDDGFDGEI